MRAEAALYLADHGGRDALLNGVRVCRRAGLRDMARDFIRRIRRLDAVMARAV